MIEGLFASGRIAELIAGLVAIEAIALGLVFMRAGRAARVPSLLANLAAGGALLMALRAAIVGSGWQSVGIFLGLAFAAHIADVALRWRE
jgi:anti-sigma factor RsiW